MGRRAKCSGEPCALFPRRTSQGVGLLEGIAKAPRRREVDKIELWVTGHLSLWAKEEIEQAGWEVHERAFSRLYGKK